MNKLDLLLINHKIIPGYLGYSYIKDILNNYTDLCNVGITPIYKEVARKFNATWTGVERAIRHALSKSDLEIKQNKSALAYLILEYEGMMVNE